MTYQIDQSGKVEQTNRNTVLCLSNNLWDAVMITAKTKRQLQEIFRRHGQIRNFVLFTFCAAVAFIIKSNHKCLAVTIDQEYFGKEKVIKNIVLEMLKNEVRIPEIAFMQIGRRVNAHKRAYLIFTKKLKAKRTLSLEVVLETIKKTEVGKRLKDA